MEEAALASSIFSINSAGSGGTSVDADIDKLGVEIFAPNEARKIEVVQADFREWAKRPQPNKFNVIHCDFPISSYFAMLDIIVSNHRNFMRNSAHILFWIQPQYFDRIFSILGQHGFIPFSFPLVWTQSNPLKASKTEELPQRNYEMLMLARHGIRPLIEARKAAYSAPRPINPVHPQQRSESVLRHFLGMIINETTDFLDPTCGSGTALRAADACGARSIFGIEFDPKYAAIARTGTIAARSMAALKVKGE